jgi:hypothetical protein
MTTTTTIDDVASTLVSVRPGISLDRGHPIAEAIHGTRQAIECSGPCDPAEDDQERLDPTGLRIAPLEGE